MAYPPPHKPHMPSPRGNRHYSSDNSGLQRQDQMHSAHLGTSNWVERNRQNLNVHWNHCQGIISVKKSEFYSRGHGQ